MEVATTPIDEARFKHIAHTTTVAVGYTRVDAQGAYAPFGSGTIVRLADRHFVFTAGHNLEKCRNEEVWLGFMRSARVPVPLYSGNYYGRGYVRPEGDDADVAIIELRPEKTAAWQEAEPFCIEDMGCHESIGLDECVLLCGCPGAESRQHSVMRDGAPRPELSIDAVAFATAIAPGPPIPMRAFLEARQFCVYYGEGVSVSGEEAFIDPAGYSGGPVVLVHNNRRVLAGLAQSFVRPCLLCEPIWCALQFLDDCHPDADVRAEAQRGLARLGRR